MCVAAALVSVCEAVGVMTTVGEMVVEFEEGMPVVITEAVEGEEDMVEFEAAVEG